MRTLAVAMMFLTRVPMPRVVMRDGDVAAAVRLYPIVGLAIGLAVALAGRFGAILDPWLGALLALMVWAWITGALHLDGLADLADGLGAWRGDRERLLTVMADPVIGSFGAVTLVLQIVAKLVLVHLLLPVAWPVLIMVPAAARMGPLLWAYILPPLRPSGLGAAIAGAVRLRDLIGWGLVLAGACVVAPALLATPILAGALLWWMQRRLGGVTGDVHGAGVELTESGLLLVTACIAHWPGT